MISLSLPFIIESCDEIQQSNYLSKISKITGLSYDLLKIEASSSKKSSYKKNRKTIRDDERIKRVIFNHEKAQEKYFLAILLDSPELFDSVKDIQDVYFSDLHYRSLFKLWKTTNEVVTLKDLDEDLKFIYEDTVRDVKDGQMFYFNANKRHSVFSTSDDIIMLVFCMKFDELLFERLIEQYRFA